MACMTGVFCLSLTNQLDYLRFYTCSSKKEAFLLNTSGNTDATLLRMTWARVAKIKAYANKHYALMFEYPGKISSNSNYW